MNDGKFADAIRWELENERHSRTLSTPVNAAAAAVNNDDDVDDDAGDDVGGDAGNYAVSARSI